ncbi:MAG TPA: phosphoribosyltransferase family protein [Acidimicrobiales bacterium]|nr:phosphoribosyltransferase family protein [Acidimicrobiales bacterium]
MQGPAIDRPPRPVGFPGCRLCPYRDGRRPAVCLACLGASPGQQRAVGLGGRCASCGQARPAGAPCPTAWCRRRDRGWSVVFAVGAYRGGLRRAVLRYKYGGETWWAGVFGGLVAAYLDAHAGWFEEFDLLTGVPAYTGAGGRRRWDPVSGILAEVAAAAPPGWAVEPGAVVKRSETPPLSGTGRTDRLEVAGSRLREALHVPRPADVAGRRVLVLDDVLTEGSTLREVALALRVAGAREVAGLVLARTPWAGAAASPPRAGERPGGGR